MRYENISPARFIDRPNRFIANIEVDGKPEVAHVKNTGRCRELLVPGAEIYVQRSDNPNRKTLYDLISVKKGDRLINMDSNAPNKVFAEWLNTSGYFKDITLIRPETTFENSRFDFYLEAGGEKIFIEVKGVTLEDGGIVRFPDAPTERGVKHIRELIRCKSLGFGAYIAFVIQMENVRYFEPNRETNPELADALIDAVSSGVGIIAFDCRVSPETLTANAPVEVRLN